MRLKLSLLLSGISFFTFSQNFTWVKGSSSSSVAGVYGTQGVAAPGNTPGGRHGCATWTDAGGNLWLFGGEGYSTNLTLGWLNDLWKYNPSTNQWTWIRGSNTINPTGSYGTQGVASPLNDPSPREFITSWTDASGNFWMFGGDLNPQNKLGDLWKYTPSTNQWTWMKGPNTPNVNGVYGTQNISAPGNFPGSRSLSSSWVDNNGKLWLFGGRGYGASALGTLNDLWKFDPLTNEWTWVSGSPSVNVQGVYGTLGVAAPGNYPGGHTAAATFVSTQGNLVFATGHGYASTGAGFLNDMWEFDMVTGNWKWLSGSNLTLSNAYANYGTQNVPSSTTRPGGRMTAASWTDISGNYWLFGGQGLVASNTSSQLNDLFMYNPGTNQWTWIKGANQNNQNGTYGTQGVTAAANVPGARDYNSWWRNTSTGQLWLFGGQGYDATQNFDDQMNDLWKFNVPCNPDSAKIMTANPVCSGGTVSVNAYSLYPMQVSWFTSPTSTSVIGSGTTFPTPTLTAQSSASVYTYYAGATVCTISPRSMVTITVLPLPAMSITGPSSLCPGQSTVINISGTPTQTWNTGPQTNTLSVTAGTTSLIWSATGTGTNGCKATKGYTLNPFPLPNVGASSSHALSCAGDLITITASGASSYTWNATSPGISISASPTITTSYTVEGIDGNGCSKSYTYTQFVAACVGIEDPGKNSADFQLFPNPNAGHFYLSTSEAGNFVIINALGMKMSEVYLEGGKQMIETNLEKGIYTYEFISEQQHIRKGKLVVE